MKFTGILPSLALGAITVSALQASAQATLSPKSMKLLGEVDPRFASYNVEAVEVTGGRFWAPYSTMTLGAVNAPQAAPGKTDDSDPRFRYRAPINLANPKLRNLASALGPSFVRVSGTWRNSTYFQNNDDAPLMDAPAGFKNVLTRAEWKGVVDFAHAVQGDIVASVTTSQGVRDKDGAWNPAQAKAWLDYTKSIGGSIAAMEYMNEPTLIGLSGASDTYGPKEYARDSKLFASFLQKESPQTLYLGPSSAAEGLPQAPGGGPKLKLLSTESLMQATGPIFDGFSWHVYYTRSHRCMGANGTDPKTALEGAWFERGTTVEQFYSHLRDQYLPGKPLWLTETGEASCGGDSWASSFIDSFRLLDQLGSLAQHSVKSVMYNTLASSDYGMLDEDTLNPRPNYWAILLWKKTMGTKSLDPARVATDLRVYAHCSKDTSGGVSLLVLNTAKTSHSLTLPVSGLRSTLSAPDLMGQQVLLNGTELKASSDGVVPQLQPVKTAAGQVSFAPETITFLLLPAAGNPACKK